MLLASGCSGPGRKRADDAPGRRPPRRRRPAPALGPARRRLRQLGQGDDRGTRHVHRQPAAAGVVARRHGHPDLRRPRGRRSPQQRHRADRSPGRHRRSRHPRRQPGEGDRAREARRRHALHLRPTAGQPRGDRWSSPSRSPPTSRARRSSSPCTRLEDPEEASGSRTPAPTARTRSTTVLSRWTCPPSACVRSSPATPADANTSSLREPELEGVELVAHRRRHRRAIVSNHCSISGISARHSSTSPASAAWMLPAHGASRPREQVEGCGRGSNRRRGQVRGTSGPRRPSGARPARQGRGRPPHATGPGGELRDGRRCAGLDLGGVRPPTPAGARPGGRRRVRLRGRGRPRDRAVALRKRQQQLDERAPAATIRLQQGQTDVSASRPDQVLSHERRVPRWMHSLLFQPCPGTHVVADYKTRSRSWW